MPINMIEGIHLNYGVISKIVVFWVAALCSMIDIDSSILEKHVGVTWKMEVALLRNDTCQPYYILPCSRRPYF
jgi:hypothetical protein